MVTHQTAPTETVPRPYGADWFQNFLESRNEPDWLKRQRRAAFELFQNLDLPGHGDEELRRTDLRGFSFSNFLPAAAPKSQVVLETLPEPVPASEAAAKSPSSLLGHVQQSCQLAGSVWLRDGQLQIASIWQQLADRGLIIDSLDNAVRHHADLVHRYFVASKLQPSRDKFAAAHAAFWSGGLLVYVPKGVQIEEPLHAIISFGRGNADSSRIIIVVDEGAEAHIWLERCGGIEESPALHNGTLEIHLEQGASLNLLTVQDWRTNVWNFFAQHASIKRDARLLWLSSELGSKLTKSNQSVSLQAEGAEAEILGVVCVDDRQHVALHTLQLHQSPRTRSNLLYKGALQDKSRLVWRGCIRVEPGAIKTDAYQRNDNLLLSPNAHADSIPGLEIEADDVRCTHGATAGRVDQDQVFYCMTRGLSEAEAIKLIVHGFYGTVLDRADPRIATAVEELLSDKLGL